MVPVLLYDGECGFCAGSVQFALRREPPDARGRLFFAPLQGTFGTQLRQRFPDLISVDSVVWFDPTQQAGQVLVRSDAALAVLRHLGGLWTLLGTIGSWVPRVVRDTVYDIIARRRFELAARSCLLPTPDERARFLD